MTQLLAPFDTECRNEPRTPEYKGEGQSRACLAGQLAELAFAVEATKRGLMAFFPVGHSTKIDVVLECPGVGLVGVQVKKGSAVKTGWYVNLCQVVPKKQKAGFKTYRLAYSRNDFDVLAIYLEERGSFVFIAVDDMPAKGGMIVNPCNQDYPENNWEVIRDVKRLASPPRGEESIKNIYK